MDRPVTTLFMLMSVDGKISTGASDDLDVDKDFPQIAGVREGLHQYYEIEQTTDLWTLNSGRVQAKIGVNTKEMPNKSPVSFAIIDNRHLNGHGVRYLCALSKELVLITSNREHPAFSAEENNIHIIYQEKLSLKDALARLKSEQAGLLERDYAALNQAYAVNAKLFHDFHNHIGVLQQLLSRQKTKEAAEYLNALQEPVREMAGNVWTGDETIDYLINSKANKAKSDGTDFRIQVEFPRRTNLKSADLCAILGNLLDNALEAARQVPEMEKRYIRLTIRRINQMIVIKVENSYASGHASPLMEKDGALKTTKEDNGLHGWGLKSAQTAAEKYDGCVLTSYTDTDFRAVATLSYEGVPIR